MFYLVSSNQITFFNWNTLLLTCSLANLGIFNYLVRNMRLLFGNRDFQTVLAKITLHSPGQKNDPCYINFLLFKFRWWPEAFAQEEELQFVYRICHLPSWMAWSWLHSHATIFLKMLDDIAYSSVIQIKASGYFSRRIPNFWW